MSDAYRPNRKATDSDIIKLNSLGLSLRSIGQLLDCHPTTITLRLQDLGVPPADTRRAFMEDIYNDLSIKQREWLADQLGPQFSIKDYFKTLLVREFSAAQSQGAPNGHH